MAPIQRALLVGLPAVAGAELEQSLRGAGIADCQHVASEDLASVLGSAAADLLIFGAALPAGSALACQGLSAWQAAGRLLVIADALVDPQALTLAAELGCAAVLPLAASTAVWQAALQKANSQRQAWLAQQQLLQRLGAQLEDLRQRSLQQAERFQETQETYFLDLSRMMTIITNIMDGIVFVDGDGKVTLLNPAAEDLLGARSFVALGRPMQELQGRPELLAALLGDLARLAEQKELVRTVEVHHSEQDLLYIECRTSRVHDYRGQPAGALCVLRDITAEYKTDQLKNQYLSIVAHELRTPLTGIKTFATMLAKGRLGGLSERQQQACECIREQSQRLEHQIDKLINLGNIESADYGQDRECFPASELPAGLLAPFEQAARDRGIALNLHCTAADEQLHADRSDLRRACQALVENAVKFTPDGGRVDVYIQPADGGGLMFRVVDTGIGIDPRYQRRIFEKFFQVEDPLTRHHGGAGLGLFVARGIVEAHGSRIEVSSQLGQGADFHFALPVHRSLAVGV